MEDHGARISVVRESFSSGVELMHMIRKGQTREDVRGLTAAQQLSLLGET